MPKLIDELKKGNRTLKIKVNTLQDEIINLKNQLNESHIENRELRENYIN